jgi:hypothetical protein
MAMSHLPDARAVALLLGLQMLTGSAGSQPSAPANQAPAADASGWEVLFDGERLGRWQPSTFFRAGPVTVERGQIVLGKGQDLTGVTWAGPDLPGTGYEIRLQAMRIEGTDFFAGITFPVDGMFCTLILGGWGGYTVGLSSINGRDASENDTNLSIEFESGRWYDVRLRVTPAKIEAWLDDRQIVDQEVPGHDFDTRLEVDRSLPFGIASWQTKAAIRDIRLRRLAVSDARD